MPAFEGRSADAEAKGETQYMTEADIGSIVADVVSENYQRLAQSNNLTGDWLLYAIHDENNYYLSVTTHDIKRHDEARREIDAMCCSEFPFLKEILEGSIAP